MSQPKDKIIDRRKFLLGLAGYSLLSWPLPKAKAYQPFAPFSFAHVSDVHLTNEEPDSFLMLQESQLFLQQLVKELNAERVDFVMFGGDQAHSVGRNNSNWALFLDCLQPLNASWAFVLGERDISGDTPIDKNKTYAPDWQELGIKTDTSWWSHNPKSAPDLHIIGLDSSLPNTTVGGLSGKQLTWLKQDLEDHKKNFTMVFCHHPLLPPPPYDGGPPWDDYVVPDAASVREILANYPQVKLVLTGHVHVSKVQAERGIFHISSPSLAVYPCAYRIFHVSPDMVTMETRSIAFPALVRKARHELAASAMAQRFSSTNGNAFVDLIEGDKLDNDAMIPMKPGQQMQAFKAPKEGRRAAAKEEDRKVENKEKQQASEEHQAGEKQEGEKETSAQNSESADSGAKRKRGLFHKGEKEPAPAKRAARSPKTEQLPDDKPVELPAPKDIDAALNKQLNIDGGDKGKDK